MSGAVGPLFARYFQRRYARVEGAGPLGSTRSPLSLAPWEVPPAPMVSPTSSTSTPLGPWPAS
eukprot:1054464-Lingulodinium_polyedra.AAC.1